MTHRWKNDLIDWALIIAAIGVALFALTRYI